MTIRDFIEQKTSRGERVTLQFVGDSITWGENHCTADETYCAEIAKLFAAEFPLVSVFRYDGIVISEKLPLSGFSERITVNQGKCGEIVIIRNGIGGNTVRRVIHRREDLSCPSIKGNETDIFLTMLGINDALKSDPQKYVTTDRFYEDYCELYHILKEINPNAKIVLITPSYNATGSSRENELDAYCDMIKKLASDKHCAVIDLHQLWMDHLILGGENYGQGDWLSGKPGDNCHFSKEGSRNSAVYIWNRLLKIQI